VSSNAAIATGDASGIGLATCRRFVDLVAEASIVDGTGVKRKVLIGRVDF
jgi:NAD(P)-dependent dehydrogenase (short-subunit alcohol dehydrogenase family)